jgi:hypothetical protein
MARGWESKSVEAQQADAFEQSSTPKERITAEQAAQVRERDSLRLARQRIVQQLESNHDPRRRPMLESSLASLDEKLAALNA